VSVDPADEAEERAHDERAAALFLIGESKDEAEGRRALVRLLTKSDLPGFVKIPLIQVFRPPSWSARHVQFHGHPTLKNWAEMSIVSEVVECERECGKLQAAIALVAKRHGLSASKVEKAYYKDKASGRGVVGREERLAKLKKA
jgi:hypothetical protein